MTGTPWEAASSRPYSVMASSRAASCSRLRWRNERESVGIVQGQQRDEQGHDEDEFDQGEGSH